MLAMLLCAGPSLAREHPPIEPGDGRGRLFISPMGEPFRAEHGPERQWFDGADADRDGRITRAEFEADALRWFAVLDANHDGEVDPGEVERYETALAPEIRVRERRETPDEGGAGGRRERSGGGAGGQGMHFGNGGSPKPKVHVREGAARFGYLDLPEPVVSADRNGNRGIDRTEFLFTADQRFGLLDRNGDGAITRSELPRLAVTR